MRDKDDFTPVDEYGIIGDRRSAALAAPDGSIDWLCWPHFESPSIFGALLDPDVGGCFKAGPAAGGWGRMRYDGETNLLVTRFKIDSGVLTLGDSMTRPGDRPEGDPQGGEFREILRCLTCETGQVDLAVDCAPCFNYGRIAPTVMPARNGIILQGGERDPQILLRLASPRGELRAAEERATARFTLRAGETAWISLLLYNRKEVAPFTAEYAESAWREAWRYWERWISRGRFPAEHREAVVRSLLTTHLLRYSETGAVIASPTTSLPEVIGGRRIYDYRFAWVRDGSLALALLSTFGYLDEAEQSMRWLCSLHSDTEAPLQVVYTGRGESAFEQEELAHLRGYRETKPIRIGNHARDQVQPDEFGIFLDCVATCYRYSGRMVPEFWELLEDIADFIQDRWREPNNGIWENIERKYFVSSYILCWVALDRAALLAEGRDGLKDKARKWRGKAAEIKEYVLEHGYDESIGSFTYTLEDKRLDASVLTAITYGMLEPDDPKASSTIKRIRERLSRGDMLLRHLMAEEADHVPRGEPARGWEPVERRDNPFHPCTCWLAQAYALAGDLDTARSIIKWVLEHAGPTGLLAEEYAPDSGEAMGNYPLVFSHMELIRAINYVVMAQERR